MSHIEDQAHSLGESESESEKTCTQHARCKSFIKLKRSATATWPRWQEDYKSHDCSSEASMLAHKWRQTTSVTGLLAAASRRGIEQT